MNVRRRRSRKSYSHSNSIRFHTYDRYFNGLPWNHLKLSSPLVHRNNFHRDELWTIQSFASVTNGQKVRVFPHLQPPTAQDAYELFRLMDSKPGSLLTTLFDGDDLENNDPVMIEKYNIDWTGQYRGFASIVARPRSTDEVSRIMRYCNERRIGIVPQGGNTGLVGGSIPISSYEIVLSLEKMDRIESHIENTVSDRSVIRAEAGCVLQDLQEYASKNKCLVPVDLGAKGTCQIGGNVSTNAGGVYYYRYGSLHANILGLEVVTPKGDILNLGYSPISLLKDNTGYHLKHLFIGGEGTLGVVTKVALRCEPLPVSRGAVWLSCTSLQNVVEVLSIARTKKLNEILAAFEFMDNKVLELVKKTHPSIRFPLDISSSSTNTISEEQYTILVETHGSNYDHDMEKLESFLECIIEKSLVSDGVMARNLSEIEEFWNARELCNPASAATGFVYKYDVSLAASDFENFIRDTQAQLEDLSRTSSLDESLICVNWGHIIDGNLHCNIISPGIFVRDTELSELIDETILGEVVKRNGSISAEHGLGQKKHIYLPRIKDSSSLEAMYGIKNLLDPNHIMNPGKYLPPLPLPI
eukprot:CAMPEP_0197194202 /NCGR_PEP_ID=MMETSP1423-20130617/28812_1 /TAXON_ID=476441 /ORGANISM="Pseudo-nitzschia heimii, Strain UNC1101" /LENGTH=583 /DNA_ID=CAMNT_0042647589 /DNA_START=77 /DNA_END=1828 /DNA_ORIENTATION=+